MITRENIATLKILSHISLFWLCQLNLFLRLGSQLLWHGFIILFLLQDVFIRLFVIGVDDFINDLLVVCVLILIWWLHLLPSVVLQNAGNLRAILEAILLLFSIHQLLDDEWLRQMFALLLLLLFAHEYSGLGGALSSYVIGLLIMVIVLLVRQIIDLLLFGLIVHDFD